MNMLNDNGLIKELKEIGTTLRISGEHRKANMINMAIQKIGHCHKIELDNKDKLINDQAETILKVTADSFLKDKQIKELKEEIIQLQKEKIQAYKLGVSDGEAF